jgi:hypothetical protein
MIDQPRSLNSSDFFRGPSLLDDYRQASLLSTCVRDSEACRRLRSATPLISLIELEPESLLLPRAPHWW